ncbi:F-type H+-transporting ATPase subunit gamma [Nitrosomonas marina]|uniref:F-type H+-transporting ATPase subunit gamma n=1 Tax=Nitrosomonas marina TaxID=917 RepID=A0A1I0DX88_9PROT|nr:FoF1 ATP synthase subunit gamma [Nitrosomonas marina]SET37309.1 F-type H+-transporting ATPase subunit gamma [Nitrosomonas marina]
MSKRHDIKTHIATLGEIKGILSAMKNMALLEIRKLDVFLSTQQRVITSIESLSHDFLGFYGHLQTIPDDFQHLWIVIGSERGFCGDFNKMLGEFVRTHDSLDGNSLFVVVGNQLLTKFTDDKRVVASISGHSVSEEIQVTLLHLAEILNQLQQQFKLEKIGRISAVYHDNYEKTVRFRQLLPLETPQKAPDFAYPPQLHLKPSQFLAQLTDQYLYAALHQIFYSSLMVENHMRLEHMENAIHRLEKNVENLQLQYNKVRQEEIIEEIEIILLSAEALSDTQASTLRLHAQQSRLVR